MTSYSLFGYRLSSELDFPELPESPDVNPRWRIRPRPAGLERPSAALIREAVALPCALRLYRTPAGYLLEHRCTGSYFVSGDGSLIEFEPRPGASLDAVRLDLLGRVMALALHAGGFLCLHGSGIRLDGGVVGFIAPKGSGKSTLASALLRAGAQLVSDDLLVIEPGRPPMALPGVARLRLRDDAFGTLLLDVCKAERGPDGKRVVRELSEERLMVGPAPLLALYWLDPVPSAGSAAALREPLPVTVAAQTLVSMGKNAIIMGQMETFDVLEHALTLARQIPVYRLTIPRDLDRIGDVAQQMVEWHGADAPLSPFAP